MTTLDKSKKNNHSRFKIIYSYLHVFGSGGSEMGAASGMGSDCWVTVSAAGSE